MSDSNSKIITFYSYKGGVGRSMAIANTAWLLADRYKKKILIVDWDLDAPGLHRFLNLSERKINKGLINIFYDYKELLREENYEFKKDFLNIDNYIITIEDSFENGGSLKFLPAGSFDDKYIKLVNEFDWEEFYENWRGYGFIEYIKKQFRKKADIILIDSRTGITDIGGICTLQIPDLVVLLFSLNEQNISGTEMIIKSILNKSKQIRVEKSVPKIIVVPSRIERYLEQDRREKWEKMAAQRLGHSLKENEKQDSSLDIKKDSIPYVGFYSFGEDLSIKKHPNGELADSYNRLSIRILKETNLWENKFDSFTQHQDRSTPFSLLDLLESIPLVVIGSLIMTTIFYYQTKGPISEWSKFLILQATITFLTIFFTLILRGKSLIKLFKKVIRFFYKVRQ